MNSDTLTSIYLPFWICLCVFAVYLAIRNRKEIAYFDSVYWRYLAVPWKLVTFVIALAAFNLAAPFSGDPSWDYTDSIFMSILTYTTAPWAIGVIYRCFLGKVSWVQLYVAMCTALFSFSWSYDLYLLFRDGAYTDLWLANLKLSALVYIAAGLMWNLIWKEDRGVIFGFMADDWLVEEENHQFSKVVLFVVPFVLFVGVLILAFVWEHFTFLI